MVGNLRQIVEVINNGVYRVLYCRFIHHFPLLALRFIDALEFKKHRKKLHISIVMQFRRYGLKLSHISRFVLCASCVTALSRNLCVITLFLAI